MNSFAGSISDLDHAPRLRLMPATAPDGAGQQANGGAPAPPSRPSLRLVGDDVEAERPVLVAGADAQGRDAVLRDLTASMPADTVFEQAAAVWEVLVRAGDCRMVVISGELDDVTAESLLQMLAHRHPALPVVSLAPSSPRWTALPRH